MMTVMMTMIAHGNLETGRVATLVAAATQCTNRSIVLAMWR